MWFDRDALGNCLAGKRAVEGTLYLLWVQMWGTKKNRPEPRMNARRSKDTASAKTRYFFKPRQYVASRLRPLWLPINARTRCN